MDKHTPEEENGSTSKLSLPLEKGKQKKQKTYELGLEVMKEGCVLAQLISAHQGKALFG